MVSIYQKVKVRILFDINNVIMMCNSVGFGFENENENDISLNNDIQVTIPINIRIKTLK